MPTGARQAIPTFLVEHYWPGVTPDAFRRAAELVATAAVDLSARGKPIRFLHSTFVPGDEAAVCVFEAGSAALVAEAYARAGVPFERIVEAIDARPGATS